MTSGQGKVGEFPGQGKVREFREKVREVPGFRKSQGILIFGQK